MAARTNVTSERVPPTTPLLRLLNYLFILLSPWETKCQCGAGTAAALAAADRRRRSAFSLTVAIKVERGALMTCSILRGNCAFDWLNERQFPSPHRWSFVAVVALPLSSSPKGCVSTRRADGYRQTPRITGELYQRCCVRMLLFLYLCMLVLSFAWMLGENHINLVCWECPAENWGLGCSSWKDFFFLLSRGYKESHRTSMKIKMHPSPKSFYMQIGVMGGGL